MAIQRIPGSVKNAIKQDIAQLGGTGAVAELLGIPVGRVSARSLDGSGQEFTISQVDRIIAECAKRNLHSHTKQHFNSHEKVDLTELPNIPEAIAEIVDNAAKVNRSFVQIANFAELPRSKKMNTLEYVVDLANVSSRLQYTLSKQAGEANA